MPPAVPFAPILPSVLARFERRRVRLVAPRAETSREDGNGARAPSAAEQRNGNGSQNGSAAASPSRPAMPVRRRKGSLKKSRKRRSLASSMTPTKVPITETASNVEGVERLGAEHLVDDFEETDKDRPFIPVTIPRNDDGETSFVSVTIPGYDDGRVFELEYKSSIKDSGPLVNDPSDACILPKPIYVVSDCTGESAANTVRAALGQFENCFKMSCPANLLIFRFLSTPKKAYEIVEEAAADNALVVFTLVDHNIITAMRAACLLYEVKYVDLWSNLLDHMEDHLDLIRSGVPLGRRDKSELSKDYFKMIEAVEFTRKMDDGAHPERWFDADLLLLGVSRSGKTPLCIYLGQRGYKVANLPLVQGIPLPKQLHEVYQSKVFGLLIDPHILMDIRNSRIGSMGVEKSSTNYASMKNIHRELEYARNLYAANPDWPVLNVTHCGVEEAAARILKILSDRHGHVHPLWAGTGGQTGDA